MSAGSSSGLEQDFATQLRTHTVNQHASSSTIVNLSAPFALSSPRIYRLLLVSFYYVFKALEEELETRRLLYPKISPIYFRELLRTPAFEKDLGYYYECYANDMTNIPPPSPATCAYVAEMRAAVNEEPVLIMAYCQALYMGLLSGGVVIRRWLINAFGLTPPMGVAIFDFSDTISDVSNFKGAYADAINRVSLSDALKARIIAQKKRVFECNNELINEVCSSNDYQRRMAIVCAKIIIVLFVIYLLWRYLLLKLFTFHTKESSFLVE